MTQDRYMATMQAGALPEALDDSLRLLAGQSAINRILWTRAIAEGASIVSSAAFATLVSDLLLKTPYHKVKDAICSHIILPHYDEFDQFMRRAESLEPKEDRTERLSLPKAEQARRITDLLVDQFLLKGTGGIIGQFAAQEYLTRQFRIPNMSPRVNALSVAADKGVVFGSMFLLNRLVPEQSVQVQEQLESVLSKSGMEPEKAKEWANYTVNLQLPNLAGLAASIGVLMAAARRG